MEAVRDRTSSAAGLTLLVGPPNAGKLGRVLEWWKAREAAQPLVVVPSLPDAYAISLDLVERFGTLWGELPVVTFAGLLSLIAGQRLPKASTFVGSLLISHVLEVLPLRSSQLRRTEAGRVQAVRAFLDRLSESGRSPEELAGVLERWEQADETSRELAGDLKRLLAEYHKLRTRLGLGDVWSALERAREAAAAWRRPLAVYGFTSFTPWQRQLLASLAERVEVLLTLSYDASRPVNLVDEAEYRRWVAAARTVETLAARAPAYSSPSIAYLEANFLTEENASAPKATGDELQGVRFLLASGRRNEAELAALQVAELLRRGFQAGDIAVVVRRLEPWRSLLAEVFASCGLPYQMDEYSLLRETGLGFTFLSGVRSLLENDPARLLAYLRSPYSGLSYDEGVEVERRYRRSLDKTLARLLETSEAVHPGAPQPLQRALIGGSATIGLDVRGARQLAEKMFLAAASKAAVGSEELAADARAFRALATALEQVGSLATVLEQVGSLANPLFSPALSSTWSAASLLDRLGEVPVWTTSLGSREAVQILSVQRARARRFPVMIVLGLVEGEFPGRSERPSLLSSRQRRLFNAASSGLLPDDGEDETALFLAAISRAWQVLLLSARDAEDDGTAVYPSYFWTRAKQVLGVAEEQQVRRSLSDLVFPVAAAPSLQHYRRAIAAQAALRADPDAPVRECRHGRDAARLPRLSCPQVLAELSQSTVFSPSALETYLSCPFRWFLERVVHVERLETVLDNRLVGQLLHDVLADLYRSLDSSGLLPLTRDRVEEAEKVAAQAIEQAVRNGDYALEPADERLVSFRLKEMVGKLFRLEVDMEGRLVPVASELEVGGVEGVDIGGLRIRGRVDRVDRLAESDGLFVWDFKAGSAPKSSEFGAEEGLQVALYLLALAATEPDQPLAGGGYISLKEGKCRGVVRAGLRDLMGPAGNSLEAVDEERLAALLEQARTLARQAAAGMREGKIAPDPAKGCPDWCSLGRVCRLRQGGRRR